MENSLTDEQADALEILRGESNVFLTGAAGSGKSFLTRAFLKGQDVPVLASTGAAAILVGGRTFHSFFGLGICEGGIEATVERATQNKRVVKRIKKASTVVVDEISMLSGPTLGIAERIAREVREPLLPWGGLRVIAVGDFAQLPPVNPHSSRKEWAFQDEMWAASHFRPVVLNKIMRTENTRFLAVLNSVREGLADQDVKQFLAERQESPADGEFTRLFTHRLDVERYNLGKLAEIPHPLSIFPTDFRGRDRDIEIFRKNSPIADVIQLKKEALVMLRQNDPANRWVNGSLGRIENITPLQLTITLLTGRTIELDMAEFTMLDAEGLPSVVARNFPVSLAWGMTIHKAQGASLDRMMVDLRRVWEPGQAYVALSRARDPDQLFIEGWSERSIFADPNVAAFHRSLMNRQGLQ